MFASLPTSAAWRHVGARDGFECAFFSQQPDGHRVTSVTTAIEDGTAWAVRGAIALDGQWRTRRASVWGWSAGGERELRVESDGNGAWTINDAPEPALDGCLDVDLESSACTNTFPMHRLSLRVGEAADAPAAYVRASDLAVIRLEQRYERTTDNGAHPRYTYEAPAFAFQARLEVDAAGLVLDYPGIAIRHATPS